MNAVAPNKFANKEKYILSSSSKHEYRRRKLLENLARAIFDN